MEPKLNINFEGNDLVIRQGEALKLKEPRKVEIVGTIGSPLEFLAHRHEIITQKECHIIYNCDQRYITLIVDEKNEYQTSITGVLELSPIVKKFGINSGKFVTPLELAEFIKMHRAHFDNRDQALELVALLRAFRAKINTAVEREIDLNKGDRNLTLRKVVDSNVPRSFFLKIPVFKGTKPIEVEIETYFNPDDLTCSLVSPSLSEYVEEMTDKIIQNELKQIRELTPDIMIHEI